MENNPCNDTCHKMLIGVDESTGMFIVCHYMDIFIEMYTYDRTFILIYEPTWQGHKIYDKTLIC